MSENEWMFLMEVFDRLEGEIIKEALESLGIPCELFQEAVSHYIYPMGTQLGRIEICVPQQNLEEAQAWLDAYQQGDLNDNTPEEEHGDSEPE